MTVPSTYCTLHGKDGGQRGSLPGVLYTVYSTQYKVHGIQYTPPAIQPAWLKNNVSNAGITRSAVKASQLEKSVLKIYLKVHLHEIFLFRFFALIKHT